MTEKMDKALELTQSQTLMWIGHKMNPDVPIYNTAYAFDIFGDVNPEHFQQAFQLLIVHFDAFRTLFFEHEEVPYQTVLPYLQYDIQFVDFSLTNDKRGIQTWLKERTSLLFDFSKPLFDSALLKVGHQHYIWFLNQHHIITDATSYTIIHGKMSEIYGRVSRGNSEILPATNSFSSFVRFEAEQRKKDNSAVRKYWKEKIAEISEVPAFYGIKKVSPTTASKRISFKLGSEVSHKLKVLASEPGIRAFTEDLSIFNIFATLLFTYIYRVSGQKKLALGAPSHNRATRSHKETAGLFIEIFPLVTELTELDTFRTVLNRVKLESNMYLRYAQPGMGSAEISRSFNVIFNYINTRFSDFDGYPVTSHWIHPEHCDPAHLIRCHVYNMDVTGNIEINFDLNSGAFNHATFQKVPGHFLKLVYALISDIDQPINRPTLVERIELGHSITKRPKPTNKFKSIIGHFESQVEKTPFRVSVQSEKTTYTYQVLNRKANQLAHYLKAIGIDGHSKVALHLFRSPEYFIGVLAVLKTGAAFVPIASDQPKERLNYMLQNSGCSLLLTDVKLKDKIDANATSVLYISNVQDELSKEPISNLGITISHESLAYILYTSGSTGRPKGVMIPHKALANYLYWAGKEYKVDKNSIFPLFTSIGFDLTITATFLPLINGGRIIVYKENQMGPDMVLLKVVDDNIVNAIKLTPSHLALLQERNLTSSTIKTMIIGGEDLRYSSRNQ